MPEVKTSRYTHLNPFVLFSIIILIAISSVSSLAQEAEEPFSINVTINHIDLELQTTGGMPYVAWWIVPVEPGDTVGMVLSETVHLINNSNMPIDILSEIVDYPDEMTSDTLWDSWEIGVHGGLDTVGFRWASLTGLAVPPFSAGQVILSTASPVENSVPAGENRYLYGWFLAPLEGAHGETHRLLSTIMITPAMTP